MTQQTTVKAVPVSKLLMRIARKVQKNELLPGCIQSNDEEFITSFIIDGACVSINIQNIM